MAVVFVQAVGAALEYESDGVDIVEQEKTVQAEPIEALRCASISANGFKWVDTDSMLHIKNLLACD